MAETPTLNWSWTLLREMPGLIHSWDRIQMGFGPLWWQTWRGAEGKPRCKVGASTLLRHQCLSRERANCSSSWQGLRCSSICANAAWLEPGQSPASRKQNPENGTRLINSDLGLRPSIGLRQSFCLAGQWRPNTIFEAHTGQNNVSKIMGTGRILSRSCSRCWIRRFWTVTNHHCNSYAYQTY